MVSSKIIKTRACMTEDLSSCYSPVFPRGSGNSCESNPPTSPICSAERAGFFVVVVVVLIFESDHVTPMFKTFQ